MARKKFLRSHENVNRTIKIDGTREPIKTRENDKEKAIIELYEKRNLKVLRFKFPTMECKENIVGPKIYLSTNGKQYIQKLDAINGFSKREISGSNADLVYLFPGDEAQYIQITPPINYACELSDIDLSVFTFLQLYHSS